MKLFPFAAAMAAALALALPAGAQTQQVRAPSPSTVPLSALAYGDYGTAATPVTDASGLPVRCITGCGGGGGGTGTEFAEDSVHTSGAAGTLVLGVRKDTATALAGTDGDYSGLITDSAGLVWARIGAALPAGTNNIGDVDVLTLPALPAGANTIGTVNLGTIAGVSTAANQASIIGTKAAGTAATNSLLAGLVYNTSLPTLTTGQQAALQGDASGRLYVNVGTSVLPTGASTAAAQTAVQGTYGAATANRSVILDSVTGNPVVWTDPVPAGSCATAGCGVAAVVSTAVETGHVIKASAGNLYGFQVTTGASAGFVMVFNSATVPAAGAVTPVKCYRVAANSSFGVSYSPLPLYLGTGVSLAFSVGADCFTKTDSATAFISGNAQ